MKQMTFANLIRQCGAELTGRYMSTVELADEHVSKIIDTFVINVVALAHGTHMGFRTRFLASQLVSKIASEVALESGADETEIEEIDLDIQPATVVLLLSDGTIWFTDIEEGQNVHWCIHSPDQPLLPGHIAPRLV